MSDATKLYHLDFGSNKFIGRVPPLEHMHDLVRLNFQYNNLGIGEAGDLNFLSSWVQATNLNFLDLNSNSFGGVFPESISNFSTNFGKLRLKNKKTVGSISTRMGIWRLAQFIEDETWWTSFLEDSSWKLLGGSLEVAWRISMKT
ncbi:hypothetical protein ACSBR1_017577 [Camellia fascicularis]